MLRTRNLDILNKHAKCEEKCTKVNTKNSNEKSIINCVILPCTYDGAWMCFYYVDVAISKYIKCEVKN